MNKLALQHCSPIKADTPKLKESDARQLLEQLDGWATSEKGGELRLEKTFNFKDFNQAMAFTNLVAQAADKEDHHPAILTEWGKVTVTWWTHRIHGLHQNDFIMAAKTDQLFAGTSRD